MRYGLLALAMVLFFVWIGAFLMFHVVGALIHVVLLIALVLFVMHLFTGRKAA